MMRERFMNTTFLKSFISLYKSLPCLWQVSCPHYQLKEKRLEALQMLTELCQKIDPSATDVFVINKIRNLRTVFRKEYNKVMKAKRVGQNYQPKLWYYDLLVFTVNENYKKIDEEQIKKVELKAVTPMETEKEPEVLMKTEIETPEYSAESSTSSSEEVPSSTTLVSNQHKNESKIICLAKQKSSSEDSAIQKRYVDEFDAFGQSVAHHLRSMPFLDAMDMETRMLGLITERRTEVFKRNL